MRLTDQSYRGLEDVLHIFAGVVVPFKKVGNHDSVKARLHPQEDATPCLITVALKAKAVGLSAIGSPTFSLQFQFLR